MDYITSALGAGMSWQAFMDATYFVTSLHIKADVKKSNQLMEMLAWHATHIYRAMTGDTLTVNDLLGRVTERIDFANDPAALDRLADMEDD